MEAFLWSISFITDFFVQCFTVVVSNRILSLFVLLFVISLFVTALTGRKN